MPEFRYLICPVCRENIAVERNTTRGHCYECGEEREFVTFADLMQEERHAQVQAQGS